MLRHTQLPIDHISTLRMFGSVREANPAQTHFGNFEDRLEGPIWIGVLDPLPGKAIIGINCGYCECRFINRRTNDASLGGITLQSQQ
jgi:hypothetical protein